MRGVDQSEKYALRPFEHLARWDEFLIYHYESTGEETFFRNLRDPKARSRRLFAFHRPETLHDWVRQPEAIRARNRSVKARSSVLVRRSISGSRPLMASTSGWSLRISRSLGSPTTLSNSPFSINRIGSYLGDYTTNRPRCLFVEHLADRDAQVDAPNHLGGGDHVHTAW